MIVAAIDWGKLLEAAFVSAAFGIGVVLIGGLAVVASLRAQDRRLAREGGAIAYDVVTGACALAIAAAHRARHLHHGEQVSESDRQPDTGARVRSPPCSTC